MLCYYCYNELLKFVFFLAFSSLSTVSYVDEPSQRDDASRLTVQMENTYQLGVSSLIHSFKLLIS